MGLTLVIAGSLLATGVGWFEGELVRRHARSKAFRVRDERNVWKLWVKLGGKEVNWDLFRAVERRYYWNNPDDFFTTLKLYQGLKEGEMPIGIKSWQMFQ